MQSEETIPGYRRISTAVYTAVKHFNLTAAAAILLAVLAADVASAKGRSVAILDQNIRASVLHSLQFDKAVPADDVTVGVADGTVRLDGSVPSLYARIRAERIAATVRGVRRVDNGLLVVPGRIYDPAVLQRRVDAALANDPLSRGLDVTARVAADGEVLLSGTVGSWSARTAVEDVVCKVSGVRAIDNTIAATPVRVLTDGRMEDAIEDAIGWDALIDDDEVKVSVDNGVAMIRGTVASAAEKARVVRRAFEAGAVSVHADELNVDLWQRDEDLRDDKFSIRDDHEIGSAVRAAIGRDPRLVDADVEVEIYDRTATLSGSVSSLKAKRSAAQSARNIVGVAAVNNRIEVLSSGASDDELTAALRTAIARDSYLDGAELTATVRGGRATLSGSVPTLYHKAAADDAAARVGGISAVINQIEVMRGGAPLPYDPWVDEYSIYEYDWWVGYTPERGEIGDEDLFAHVKSGIAESAFVDSSEISVTVRDAAVFLNGRVASIAERAAAERAAYAAGATLVYNNLRVR